MATLLLLVGAGTVNRKNPISAVVMLTVGIYMVAQSTWFSSWLSGNPWGRDFSNYIWFMFNTSTMGIFGWVLLKSGR